MSEVIKGRIEMPLRGLTGKDGLSAYEVACKNGFEGSEEEWLDSIATADELKKVEENMQKIAQKAHLHGNMETIEALTDEKVKEWDSGRRIFSNALRGNVADEVVAICDISPLEHEIECKVTGLGSEQVKVYQYGKNLCSTNDMTLQGMTDNLAKAINITLPAGKYVLSAKFEQQGVMTRVGMAARSASYVNLGGTQVTSLEESGKLTYAFEITERTACKMQFWGIYGTSHTPTVGDAISVFSEIQLEIDKGTGEATDFEEYACLEYTPNADGTVEGMVSIAPNMTIMTDTANAYVDVTYNRDINKAFEDLKTEMQSYIDDVFLEGEW